MSSFKRLKNYLFSIVPITLFLINLSTIGLTYCDHLQQTNDEAKSSKEQQVTGEHRSPLADPEYIKRELKDIIMRKIDTDKDGQVSYEELKNYLAQLHEKTIEYNVNKQWVVYSPQIHEVFSWEGYEPEKKEVLTWDHYFNQTYPELVGIDIGIPITREQDTSGLLTPPTEGPPATSESSTKPTEDTTKKVNEREDDDYTDEEIDQEVKQLKLMVTRADARWKLADENGDTLLTKSEFKHLLHPDEGHEELQNLFVREATEDMDLNKDGKICLDEFMKHLQVLANEQERNDQSWLSSQQENFGRFLDKNKDGILDGAEIREWLVPAKSKKFELEAKRLLDIGDTNEDHKLSNPEILEHYDQYLSLMPPEYWRKAEETYDQKLVPPSEVNHDEL